MNLTERSTNAAIVVSLVCGYTNIELGRGIDGMAGLSVERPKVHKPMSMLNVYVCEDCQKDDIATPIVKTAKESVVISGSFATTEPIDHNQQEQEWVRQGQELYRQTMSNWVLYIMEYHLLPMHEQMHCQLEEREVIDADKTILQEFHEFGKKAQTNSYIWLYCTNREDGLCSGNPSTQQNDKGAFFGIFTRMVIRVTTRYWRISWWLAAGRMHTENLFIGAEKPASQRVRADFRRTFCMGRFSLCCTEVRAGQGTALSQGGAAILLAVSGGWLVGVEQ